MVAKKAARSRANNGQGAAQDIAERRAATNKFVRYAERVARDGDESLRVLQRAGIATSTGRLTKHYKK